MVCNIDPANFPYTKMSLLNVYGWILPIRKPVPKSTNLRWWRLCSLLLLPPPPLPESTALFFPLKQFLSDYDNIPQNAIVTVAWSCFFLKSTTLHHNICRVMHFPCILLLTIGSSLCFTWNLFCTCRNFNFVFPRWNDYYAIHSIRPEYFFRKKKSVSLFFFSCQHFKGLQYNKLGLRWFIVFRLAFLLFFPWNRTADNCTILCLIVLY